MSVRIQTGSTERIWHQALDGSLDPVTGVTDLLVSIARESDGFWLDWNDDTFKSSGWTTREQAMSEFSATNAPGWYYVDFVTGDITNQATDDTYQIRLRQSPGTTVANHIASGEIKVGGFVDDIDAAITSRAAPGAEMALVDDAITASKHDESTAYPLAQADAGSSAVARTGADGDTLQTISDQLDPVAIEANIQGHAADALTAYDPPTKAELDTAEANIRGADSDDLKALSDQLDATAVEANVEGHVTSALNTYDPPTRAEATADKDEIISEVNANETKIDALPTAADNADAVWEEDATDHLGGDKAGQYLVDAGATADPGAIADAVWEEDPADHLGADKAAQYLTDVLADTDSVNSRLPADPADESLQQASHTATHGAIASLENLSQAEAQAAAEAAMTAQGYTTARADKLDLLDIIAGLVRDNQVIDQHVYSGGNLTSARLRVYDSKANAQAAGATGLLYTFTMTATYSGSQLQTYTVVREGS